MNTTLTDLVKQYKLFVIIGSVVIGLVMVIGVANWYKSVQNEGERTQERIEALYKMSRASLSTCLGKSDIAAQVTEQEFKRLQDLLTHVAAARYTENGQPTTASGALGGGQLISALQEAYPQIDQRSWQNLQTIVVGCRGEFESSQNRIFIDAASFEEWIQTDNVFNAIIKNNFPSDSLDVEVLATGETLTGAQALEYMTRVIEVSDGRDAFRDGVLEDQELFN